jgi:NADPH-dependent curcumin reductase CurA
MDGGSFSYRPYLPGAMQEGAKVFAGTVAQVIETYGTPGFQKDEIIFGYFGWADYALVDPAAGMPVQKVPETVKPEDYHCFELTGQSAYFGFFHRAEAAKMMKKNKNTTVVVNSAAGAIGSMVTQFAKKVVGIEKVIGICGSDEKCQIIKRQCGVDIALNYNSPNFEAEFIQATPDYIDL